MKHDYGLISYLVLSFFLGTHAHKDIAKGLNRKPSVNNVLFTVIQLKFNDLLSKKYHLYTFLTVL